MSRHVSAETLARRQEGVLSARKAARIDAHMSGCARCAATKSDLNAVSAVLAATQLPPMPESLARRVQMAIASESAARAAASGSVARAVTGTNQAGAAVAGGFRAPAAGRDATAPGAAGDLTAPGAERGVSGPDAADASVIIPGRPDLPERSGRARAPRRFRLPSLSSPLVLRGLAATAAVVVIAGAGLLLANGQTASRSRPAGGGGSGQAGAVPGPAPTVAGKNASHGAAVRQPVRVNYRLDGKVATTAAMVSNTDFRRGSLARLARKDVRNSVAFGGPATYQGPSAAPTPTAGSLGTTSFGFNIALLEGCLGRVNEGREVLAATIARFLGKPATIIVLQSLKSAGLLDIAIVGRGCSASNSHVIYKTTISAAG